MANGSQPDRVALDADLEEFSREELIEEVRRLRNGIRSHRDSSGHELCWHHTWRGMTRIEDKDRYLAYLRATGVKDYKATPGNEGVFVVWRERDGNAEFFLLTLWESMEAVQGFAGPRPEAAVFYPEDEQFLVDKDNHVDHYEVLEGPAAADLVS